MDLSNKKQAKSESGMQFEEPTSVASEEAAATTDIFLAFTRTALEAVTRLNATALLIVGKLM